LLFQLAFGFRQGLELQNLVFLLQPLVDLVDFALAVVQDCLLVRSLLFLIIIVILESKGSMYKRLDLLF
jgi:hypothetical protein